MGEAKNRVNDSVEFLKKWRGKANIPEVVVVLGSGLGTLVDGLTQAQTLSYSEIPGFKPTSVHGHASMLSVAKVEMSLPEGLKAARTVAFLRGRNHAYEGFNAAEVVHNIRALVQWGCKGVILTNAAGCLETQWQIGSLMMVTDQINATGLSPLALPHGEGFEPRFVDMSRAYDPGWQAHLRQLAQQLVVPLSEGVYYGVLGPNYESPAEIRMMKTLGAHAVGMSTVLETLAARQMGAKVACLSCLTNHGAGLKPEVVLDHHDVLEVGKKAAAQMGKLVMAASVSLDIA
jgi:inosine/guanosine/xanthosine phosphorylase family protein